MKILLISTRFKPLKGGVENVVETLADSLSQDNEVIVVTSLDLNQQIASHTDQDTPPSKIKKLLLKFKYGFTVSAKDKKEKNKSSEQRYEVYRFWINLPRTFFGYVSFPYRIIFSTYSFIKFVKKFNPDVINFHFPDDSSLYIWLLYFFINKPLVLNIHGNDLHVYSNKMPYSFFIKKLIGKCKSVIVNSEYMKDDFIVKYENCSSKLAIIPNGIDVEYFKQVEAKPYFPDEYIFFVGRFVHKKGIDLLIEAFAKANIENLKLLIEGKGEEFESVVLLSKKLGIYDNIFFGEGKLDTDTHVSYQKASLFGAMPSRIEPFGIVALEMMASGIPIIASKTGGLKTIMKNRRNCLFFENENVDDFADKIKELYEDADLREKMIENNLKDVKRYDHSAVAKSYVEVYKLVT